MLPIRAAVVGLILIGVATSVARSMYPGSLISRLEPGRSAFHRSIGVDDPRPEDREAVVARFDSRFGDNRAATFVHIILGGIFLIAAPLQFSGAIRNTYRALHRWCGRALVVIGIATAVSGLFFGLAMPIAGNAERIVVALFGGTVIYALGRGVKLIRTGDMSGHRAWMIRAFAVMLGISTVRLVSGVLDPLLTPMGYSVEAIFVMSLWIGWGGTLLAAEMWLRGQAAAVRQAALAGSPVAT